LDSEQVFFYGLLAVILALGIPLLVLSIMSIWNKHKALKLYASHIKATMNLPEVKRFIDKIKKPLIEVDEDKKTNQVIVIWKDSMRRGYNPSIWVYVDKETVKPVRIQVYPDTPYKKPSTRKLS